MVRGILYDVQLMMNLPPGFEAMATTLGRDSTMSHAGETSQPTPECYGLTNRIRLQGHISRTIKKQYAILVNMIASTEDLKRPLSNLDIALDPESVMESQSRFLRRWVSLNGQNACTYFLFSTEVTTSLTLNLSLLLRLRLT